MLSLDPIKKKQLSLNINYNLHAINKHKFLENEFDKLIKHYKEK